MSGQFCRAEAKLAAPVAVRLAPQNLERTKKNSVSPCCLAGKGRLLLLHSFQ